MIVERATHSWAYSEDIPGSRCGPEDGPWPRPYQVLEEQELWRELRVLARPQSRPLSSGKYKADSVNFQPSPTTKTQDRYVVTELNVHGRLWTFTGVFDGHLGDTTVEHVAHHLPIIVRDFLKNADPSINNGNYSTKAISDLFVQAIKSFDKAIAQDVLDLFGGSIETLEQYSDSQIRQTINDQHLGGANWRKVRLCMYGTTALVALVDPDHKDLWVANLGDCSAIMVSPGSTAKDWNVEVLTSNQNGDNDAEVERIQAAHPGEPECVIDRRVLGALAPTRCFGDIPFKQPPTFTRRILYNLFPGFHNTSPWEEFLVRNLTPPYISAEPEIVHRKLDDGLSAEAMASPTAPSSPSTNNPHIISSWAYSMSLVHPTECVADAEPWSKRDNMALRLLRRAVGGEDRYGVSKVLTLDMDEAWIDDTSIVVMTI
ncbi:phosphatase 2C-like domain-containing protein [Crepidotus variabilis]|uniref:Phosphatase 2C-like domain-containing protein n=1 Tax=Crepidotus variabilis TaxID=179855 RepID=A0A9P6ERN6_9AGAR|nr:phosphatase 2C-like domain-containing protein [Crepidotus variabilis]